MLSITNLCKTYNQKKQQSVQALSDVCLTIDKGMFGLLGANGAGKSSLMRTIATLQKPDSGRIMFAGQDILTNPDFMRQHLGYLPQSFGVYNNISAYELLDYLAKLKGVRSPKARQLQINTLLEQVNLTDFKFHSVSKFSGGMKQRFGIAQALLGDPKILIVDEPTAGLDPEERNRFHNLLFNISMDKVVLLSTHIVEDVSDLCPNMAVMANGNVVTQTSPQELMNSMKGYIWQTKVSADNVSDLHQTYDVISQRLCAGEMTVHVYSEQELGSDFQQVLPNLESAYFASVHRFLNKTQGAEYA